MRLTLRTLLAYRDGVLNPAEISDLRQRIMQTEVASNLLRRIEALVHRKQLLAPKVNATGLGGDANTVAEYLDDTLRSEQVPEFERICIAESDLALAELAHCHHLLAEALNSQVEVPPHLKALAVSLTNLENRSALAKRLKFPVASRAASISAPPGSLRRIDLAHAESLVAATVVQPVSADSPGAENPAPGNTAPRSQSQSPIIVSGGGSIKPLGLDLERPQLLHEVPQYLVGQNSGGWRVPLAMGALLALLGVLVWQALGPWQSVQQLFVANEAPSQAARPTEPDSANAKKNERSPASNAPSKESSDVHSGAALGSATNPVAEQTALDEASNPIQAAQAEEEKRRALAADAEHEKQLDLSGADPRPPRADDASRLPQAQAIDNAIRWTPSGPEDLNSVLLVRRLPAGDTASLSRLDPATAFPEDAEIIVPPAMRPTLDFAGKCLWTVCGPTSMKPSLSMDSGEAVVTTSLCRGLASAGPDGRELTVVAPAGSVKLQFQDATSMASIEVTVRPVAHGSLTDALAFKPLLIIVSVEGQVTVTANGNGGQPEIARLNVGEGLAILDGQPLDFELADIPGWYRTSHDRPLDALAAADMHKLLSGSSDTAAQLAAMCADRRPETAALGIQASILTGRWQEFADDFLNNDRMRSHWAGTLSLAEQVFMSDQRSLEMLRQEFEAAHPGRGETLIALFTGTAEGKQGKDLLPTFVDLLGSTQLDERVLAWHQLRRLTGKDLGFQPSFPNRAAVQAWRREVASSRLELLPLGDPLWEAKKPESVVR